MKTITGIDLSAGDYTSDAIDWSNENFFLQAVYDSTDADVTLTLQLSFDGGTTYATLPDPNDFTSDLSLTIPAGTGSKLFLLTGLDFQGSKYKINIAHGSATAGTIALYVLKQNK